MQKTSSETSVLSILVVEDDPLVIPVLKSCVANYAKDSTVDYCDTLNNYIQKKSDLSFDLVLLDLCNAADPTGKNAIGLIAELRRRQPYAEIFVQSGVTDIAVMRTCIEQGAARFIAKESLEQSLPLLLLRQIEVKRLRGEIAQLLLGSSKTITELRETLLRYRLDSQAEVLIMGESGSGKELCAQALHSGEKDQPFVAVNAAAIPADLFEAEFFGAEKGAYTGAHQARVGFFEAAGSGTLFIDEIQSLDLSLQAKLLRVIETRKFSRLGSKQELSFNGRLVCAANVELTELVSKGRFREDLYFRISPLRVEVPPLRQRSADTVFLFKHFLAQASGPAPKLAADAETYLQSQYDWPGNVRELKALAQRLRVDAKIPLLGRKEIESALGENQSRRQIDEGDFKIDAKLSFDLNVEALEKHLLAKELGAGSVNDALQKLAMSRTRFYEKLRKYGLIDKS